MAEIKVWTIAIALLCGFMGALGQLTLKFGTAKLSSDIASFFGWQIIVGLALYVLGTFLFLYALKDTDVTIIYPMVATSYIWASIFAVLFIGETMTWNKWAGNLAIIAGVALIGYSSRKKGSAAKKGGRRR